MKLLACCLVFGACAAIGSAHASELPTPGEGVLYAVGAGAAPERFEPERTAVAATLLGSLAEVKVTQRFTNSSSRPIDAVYVFPLPHQAAVSSLTVTIGDRQLEGQVRSRAAAIEAFESARRSGRSVALVEQERPNVFTQSLASVPPGASVIVELGYDVELARRGEAFEFVYPMVVGPRFVPGTPIEGLSSGGGTASDTELVPDGSRVTPPVRAPGGRSRHSIEVNLSLSTGGEVASLTSPTHAITTTRLAEGRYAIALAGGQTVPNRDLIVRYTLAGDLSRGAVSSGTWRGMGHGELLIVAPSRAAPAAPRDIFFVIDGSSSMQGESQQQALELVHRIVERLPPTDRIAVVVSARGARPGTPRLGEPAKLEQLLVDAGLGEVAQADDLLEVMGRVIDSPRAEGRINCVVLVTDGWHAGERVLAQRIESRRPSHTRVYPVGVGAAPNRHLLELVARLGGGIDDVFVPEEDAAAVAARLVLALGGPVLSDLAVQWRGLEIADPVPERLRPLHPGQVLAVRFRYQGTPSGIARITGRLGEASSVVEVPVSLSDEDNAALARLWARERVKAFGGGAGPSGRHLMATAMAKLASDYGILSPYTAMLAIDPAVPASARVPTGALIHVPVELPLGASFEGVTDDAAGEPATAPDRDAEMGEAVALSAGLGRDGFATLELSLTAGLDAGSEVEFAHRLAARLSGALGDRLALGGELSVAHVPAAISYGGFGPVLSVRLVGASWARLGGSLAIDQDARPLLVTSAALDIAIPVPRRFPVTPLFTVRWDRPLARSSLLTAGLVVAF